MIGIWVENEATEYPRAYVVLSSSGKEQADPCAAIQKWMQGKVAHYKQLKGGIKLVESVPKSPSGKLLRRSEFSSFSFARRANLADFRLVLAQSSATKPRRKWKMRKPRRRASRPSSKRFVPFARSLVFIGSKMQRNGLYAVTVGVQRTRGRETTCERVSMREQNKTNVDVKG